MSNTKSYNIAIVGATGAVGQNIITFIEENPFSIGEIKLLSSKRSAGSKVQVMGRELIVEEATEDSFQNVDIAFFSAGGSVSEALVPAAIKSGAIAIDNTSAFRMDEDVPLVVPEVNSDHLQNNTGLIANPNCSTIQMVAALKPVQEKLGLNKIIVSTYQAVSGAGLAAEEELTNQTDQFLKDEEMTAEVLPVGGDEKHYPIAFNALPQIDLFEENGYTKEEMKMINETKKIMSDDSLSVAATCVRLPIYTSHAESIYVEIDSANISTDQFKEIIASGEGIVLEDDPNTQTYPTPLNSANKKEVFVGRIRKDLDNDKGFHLWVVSDNLIKGAAWNTVQIAKSLVEQNLIK